MTFIEFLENYNGALMFLATVISAFTTIIIAFISYKNLRELRVTRDEENRPYIVLYIDRLSYNEQKKYICIKNFGKTAGVIKSIVTTPPILPSNSKRLKIDSVDSIQNMYLAPNQRIVTQFDKSINKSTFDITLTYTTANGKKKYKESYTIDLAYLSTITWSLPNNSGDTTKELHSIANSIQGLIGTFH